MFHMFAGFAGLAAEDKHDIIVGNVHHVLLPWKLGSKGESTFWIEFNWVLTLFFRYRT